jgi:hypothetical protein
MARRAIGLAICVALLAGAASAEASLVMLVKPTHIDFGVVKRNGSATRTVTIQNRGTTNMRPKVTVTAGTGHFKIEEGNPFTCKTLARFKKCTFHVTYFKPTIPKPPTSCIMTMARNQKMIQQVVKNGKTTLKRTPFKLAVASSKDGHISVQALGKASDGKPIQLEPSDADDVAGNGVQFKLPLKKPSEDRIIADIKQNLAPKMTLTSTCSVQSTDTGSVLIRDLFKPSNKRSVPLSGHGASFSQAHAVIHFHDSKAGKAFKYPLIADPRPH